MILKKNSSKHLSDWIGKNRVSLAVFILLLGSNFPLWSHTLIFKDLTVVKGIVYKVDTEFVYFKTENGNKDVKVKKSALGKVILQDVKDEAKLKKLIKKVKDEYSTEKPVAKVSSPQEGLADIEIQDVNALLSEIEEEEKLVSIQLKRRDALVSSFLFPGLGHMELGRKEQGYLYAGSFLALAFGVVYQDQRANREIAKYEEVVSNNLLASLAFNPNFNESRAVTSYLASYQSDTDAFQSAESEKVLRNQMAFGMLAIYFTQIAHCYWIGKSSETLLDKRSISFDFSATRELVFGSQGFFVGGSMTFRY